jgi:transposase
MFGIDGGLLSRQYKLHLSNFVDWKEEKYNSEFMLFKKNMGTHLSIDETSLSQGELYTIVTNKDAKGKKGSLVAIIRGIKSENVIYALSKLPENKRKMVQEMTLDLSPTMKLISKKCFPNASLVCDRFHVQRLMNEAVNDLRISYRWQAIDLENAEIELAKEMKQRFIPYIFSNGDTRRQLLARSRHLILQNNSKWTKSQTTRAEILFEQYPEIKKAYQVSLELTQIYNLKIKKEIALTKFAHWYNKVDKLNCKFFKSVIQTMQNNYRDIVNYFDNRSTNASAESFNAKIKAFRAQFRGVRDIPFFIFRLAKLFA